MRRSSVAVGLTAAAVLYNNLMNLWEGFSAWPYVVVNVAAAGVAVLVSMACGLTARDLGLAGNDRRRAGLAGVAAAGLVAPMYLALLFEATRAVIADDRVAGMEVEAMLFHALVRIPIGTAAFEEVVFRGVLFSMWRAEGDRRAAVVSSAAFGLWHIVPSLGLATANRPDASLAAVAAFVLGAVVATAVGGLFFCWLRVKTRGLAGPIAFHATINSLALIAAVLAGRST